MDSEYSMDSQCSMDSEQPAPLLAAHWSQRQYKAAGQSIGYLATSIARHFNSNILGRYLILVKVQVYFHWGTFK